MKFLLFLYLLLHVNRQVFSNEGTDTTNSASYNETEQRVDAAAESLFEEYWQTRLMDYPEIATRLGDHRYDDRLTCHSLKCYERRKVIATEFLERAEHLLPLLPEDSQTYNDIQLLIIILQYQIDLFMSGSYLFPFSMMNPPQKALRSVLKYTKFENSTSYWNLLSRYRAFPKQIDERIELMREGIRRNFTLHENTLWKRGESENISISDSPFYKPFLNISLSFSDQEITHIQDNASDAVINYIYPALKKIDDFMEEEYRPNTRTDIGVSILPNGQEYYRRALSYHLTDPKATAEEIYTLGVSEVQHIADEMEEVIQSLGLNMTRNEFTDNLRNDKAQFFSSQEEALETYRVTISDVITPKLPQLFKNIPERSLSMESIPADLSGMKAFYMPPPAGNSMPGIFFLGTSSLQMLPRYEVITLALHEGVPGHHLQIAYAMDQVDVPDFRRYGFNSNAYTEGWALYAEYLGYELGLYDDPYMRYGHLSEEIFRACRMVVDTGIHVFGWSRQKAIDYMMNYSASTLNNIEREVDRYTTWPASTTLKVRRAKALWTFGNRASPKVQCRVEACAYKYGELKIKEFRRRAETALGEDFDIKEFHDVILRNSGPLELVEKQVDIYITKTRNAVPGN